MKRSKPLQRKKPLKKNPKPKRKSIAALKKDADKWFSRYIRYRDGELVNNQWITPCITCPKETIFAYFDSVGIIKYNSAIQAGHFQSRRYNSTRYHECNVNGQCSLCNNWGAGEQYRHSIAIDQKFGKGTADTLCELAQEVHKFTREELQGIIDKYKALVDAYESRW